MQRPEESREEFLRRRRAEAALLYRDIYAIGGAGEPFDIGAHQDALSKKQMDG